MLDPPHVWSFFSPKVEEQNTKVDGSRRWSIVETWKSHPRQWFWTTEVPIPTFARPNLPKKAVLQKKLRRQFFFSASIFFWRTAFFWRFGLAKVGIGSSVVQNHCLGCDFQVCTMLHRREPSTFVFCSSTLGEKKLQSGGRPFDNSLSIISDL